MSLVRDQHHQAMDFAEKALAARATGDHRRADQLFRQALEHERLAADAVASGPAVEPSRSVLYRSAATLALDCKEFREAERLIAAALAGDPPEEIAEELRQLFDQVNMHRHLDLQGLTLESSEVQLSLAGNAVGTGIVRSSCFLERIEATRRLLLRTAERARGRPFRDAGRLKDALKDDFALFVSVPRAASFAVTLRLGRPKDQLQIPETLDTHAVIDEMLQCLGLFAKSDEPALKQRIRDEAYYRNFVGLASKIAPDGEDVKLVGFSAVRDGELICVALDSHSGSVPPSEETDTSDLSGERVTITGELRVADSSRAKGRIRIIDGEKQRHDVIVPSGMMADIVKPLWEDIVVVTGIREGSAIRLEGIRKATHD